MEARRGLDEPIWDEIARVSRLGRGTAMTAIIFRGFVGGALAILTTIVSPVALRAEQGGIVTLITDASVEDLVIVQSI